MTTRTQDRAPSPAERSETPVEQIFYVPITRIDQDRREVEGVATSEAVDSFGTVFDYAASKAAFGKWAGNVREMHDRKAVGRKVDLRFDDDKKQITVRSRISAGAEDTWQKVLDGTLNGYSIGANGATWQRDGATAPRCTAYNLAELSLVDAASNPDARGTLTIARVDGDDLAGTDTLEVLPDPEPVPADEPAADATPDPAPEARAEAPAEERAGATISAATRDKLHSMRDQALGTAQAARDACGCEDCAAQHVAPAPDGDDGRALLADLERVVASAVAPLHRDLSLLRSVEAARPAVAMPDLARFDALPAQLDTIATRLAAIEAQPLPGGPAQRAVGLHAADKGMNAPPSPAGTQAALVAELQRLAAHTSDQGAQVAIATRILELQRGQ